jgi:RNA polymerase sigma-70 factor, ECF subfamily
MSHPGEHDRSADDRLVERAKAGNVDAVGEMFTRHRDRLRRMVEMRLDHRLRARIDPSDVVQEGYADVLVRLNEYFTNPKLPFFLWLRLVVGERLIRAHRHHLGAQMREATREVSLYRGALPAASSNAIANQLLGRLTSPTQAVIRAERLLRLQSALNELAPLDREILCLRHFEDLNCAEAAQTLDIEEGAAAKRYVRAMKRLKVVLTSETGGTGSF